MLEVEQLSGGYGRGTVIEDVSFAVARGETVALLGPNGAGKSTLLAALSGVLPVKSGRIALEGQAIDRLPSHAIVAAGLTQVPEGRRMFAPMTVADNLRLGAVRLKGGRAALQRNLDAVYALFPRLAERRAQLAGTLSGGEQQMVAIGRALMSSPKVLLLDEPFLGLAPRIVEEIRAALGRLAKDGLTMLLVEQKLDIALSFASRALVLIRGRIALAAPSSELAARDDLARLYFDLAHA
jgi:branched-chain amino acid transport system ATP-binding protein